MSNIRTTKKDFELFVAECDKWREKLGVKDWSLHYDHDEVDGVYAQTRTNLSGRVAVITLSNQWDDLREKTPLEIKKLALHEMLHVIMAPLLETAKYRYLGEGELEAAEHMIIRQLENMFYE